MFPCLFLERRKQIPGNYTVLTGEYPKDPGNGSHGRSNFFSNPTLFSIISWSFQTFRCFSQSVRISKQTLIMNFSWKSYLKKHSELTIFKTKETHRFLKSASFSGKTLFFLGLKYSWCYTQRNFTKRNEKTPPPPLPNTHTRAREHFSDSGMMRLKTVPNFVIGYKEKLS